MSKTFFSHGRGGFAIRLSLSSSLLALGAVAGAPAFAQDAAPASAQTAQDDNANAELVVTGTRIKGIDPVGSAVIPIDRKEMEKLGTSTTTDALRKLPQLVNFGGSNDQAGGSTIQNSSLNSFFAKSVNLRGLGTASTLNLVDGHRVAPQGSNGQLFDADNIPGIALERIEVVADGGSAIYGSDAIGGVVNYILRRPENTLEAQFRAGFADGVQQYIASAAFGRKWSTGGFFLAYEYQNISALKASDRPNLYNSDLSPYGGGANPLTSNPGNVQFSPNGPAYGIPAGQNGSNVTLGNLTNTVNRENAWDGADAIPSGERHSVTGTFEQEFSDSIKFKADGFFSRRNFTVNEVPQTATLVVPNTNPYSPCAAGKPQIVGSMDCSTSGGTVYVPYNFLNDLGPTTTTGYEQLWSISGTLDAKLGGTWDASITGYYSEDKGYTRNDNQLNQASLNRALGNVANGTTKPADIPYFNPFCDGTAFDCNSAATLNYFRAHTELGSKYSLYGGTANIGGSLFHIGGGDVKMSVGGEIHHDALSGTGLVSSTYTDSADVAVGFPASNSRDVESAYGEIFIPFFGADNARPGLEKLDIDAAVRYDHYSDVGSTTNPKIGVNYSPVRGLTFRGSFGTSFRAPTLVDVNPYATAGFLVANGTGTSLGLSPADASYTYVYPVGGNAQLKPERATTWSLGFDVGPELLSNTHLSLTYYNIDYKDKVDTAAYNAPIGTVLNSGAYNNFVVYNPNFFPGKTTMTEAQFVSYWQNLTSDPRLPVLGYVSDPTQIVAIVDARRNNSGIVKTDGLDFSFDHSIPTSWATFNLGAQANYTFHYKTAPVPGVALVDEVNNFGYPARFTGRLELGLQKGGFTGTAFVNYVNSRTITGDYLPAGVPAEYTHISPYTTVDLTLRYDFADAGSMFTNGLSFTITAQNLFNAQPPLVVNSGLQPIRFDPSYSSPLGRMVSFQISKKFM